MLAADNRCTATEQLSLVQNVMSYVELVRSKVGFELGLSALVAVRGCLVHVA